ncbi:MAG: cupin domain-containing protein [Burkholderiaceae bacterium]
MSQSRSSVVRFDPAPTTAPEVDHPRPERREVGDPERRSWVLHEDAAEGLVAGIWESEPGRWRIELGPREHEYFIVLEGLCRVHDAEGRAESFGPGQAVVLPPGFKGSFEVVERMRKHFVIVER